MPNTFFQFKQFRVEQKNVGMKVTTDGCLFGGWVASKLRKAEPKRILDIGAGTGLLSLMLAQATKNAEIIAVEINESAFHESSQNFKQSPWSDRLRCLHSPIQKLEDGKYDVIICNPPFFKNSQQGTSSNKNQAIHSGSLDPNDLLEHVLRLLDPNGSLYLLYPEYEMHSFIQSASINGLHPHHWVVVRNQKGQPVFREMTQFRLNEGELENHELIIRNTDRKYTQESWELLKDYYLDYNDPDL